MKKLLMAYRVIGLSKLGETRVEFSFPIMNILIHESFKGENVVSCPVTPNKFYLGFIYDVIFSNALNILSFISMQYSFIKQFIKQIPL